jgi:hypothetical protein
MESKIIEPTVVKTNKPTPLNEFQQKVLEEAENRVIELKEAFKKKVYFIDIPKADIELLGKFISKDAPWKFTECLGITEIEKELKPCIKKNKLELSAIAVEAIYYYLSKVEGFGNSVYVNGTEAESFSTISQYLKILKPVTSAIEQIKKDGEEIKNAEFVAAARREGVETDEQTIKAKK